MPQFVGFFLANLIGMTIFLLGFQFYQDIQKAYSGKDGLMSEDYVIISKHISTLGNTIFKQSSAFKSSEIEDLKEQDFVEKVGGFTSSAFKVRAGLNIMGMQSMSTDMFFESVPDEFVDTDQKWEYNEGDNFIPIIVPRDYMDLYNFGFAQSKNLPEISEGLAKSVTLDITISNKEKKDHYAGRIVGFTNRINSILVPQSFLNWANKEYASGKKAEHSRLIIKVSNPTDENLARYLQKHNYQTDSNKLKSSKTAFVLRMVLGIVMAVGVIICLLAFYILMLSIYLLIQKNSTKLENLLLLGYKANAVSRPYQLLGLVMNGVITLLAIVVLLIVRSYYVSKLASFFPSYEGAGISTTLLVGVGLFAITTMINSKLISNKIKTIILR